MGARWPMTPGGAFAARDLGRRIDLANPQGANFVSPITALTVALSADGLSVDVSCKIATVDGLDSIVILRSNSRDISTATVLQTAPASALTVGQTLACVDWQTPAPGANAYYWIKAVPTASAASPSVRGPRALYGLSTGPITPATAPGLRYFDASHSAAVNGLLTVTCSFSPLVPASFASCRIYISGYQGNANYVAVAQSAVSEFQFPLFATGEAVTLRAVGLDANGNASPSSEWLTKNLTLSTSVTVPAGILDASAQAISTGVQLQWTSGLESDITQYNIYSATEYLISLDQSPASLWAVAALVGTLASPGAGTACNYTDAAGLAGPKVWFIVAVGAAGNSLPSPPIFLPNISTTAGLPPNSPNNLTNYATVDSIDAGSSATVRIYGTGRGRNLLAGGFRLGHGNLSLWDDHRARLYDRLFRRL